MRHAIVIAILAASPWITCGVERQDAQPELAKVKRIYVEQLGGGQTSDQMRDMIIAALQHCGLFVLTENPERADAVLRGSSDDKIYTDEHNSSDSIGFRTNSGEGSGSSNAMSGSTSSHNYGGAGITDNESSHSKERRHEASASIRLVDSDGDIIWSTTQESNGGKFRGAMADVADKIMHQLVDDTRKARSGPAPLSMPY